MKEGFVPCSLRGRILGTYSTFPANHSSDCAGRMTSLPKAAQPDVNTSHPVGRLTKRQLEIYFLCPLSAFSNLVPG